MLVLLQESEKYEVRVDKVRVEDETMLIPLPPEKTILKTNVDTPSS
jgi:hypothetical protein